MRKKEFVHTHALLREVVHHFIEVEDMPPGEISTYEALEIHPGSIHKQKEDHAEAIAVLGDSIEWWIEDPLPTHSH